MVEVKTDKVDLYETSKSSLNPWEYTRVRSDDRCESKFEINLNKDEQQSKKNTFHALKYVEYL